MYIKVHIPERKDKTKCSKRCRFLVEGVMYDYCQLYGVNVRIGTKFNDQMRHKECLKAEIKS